MKILLIVLFVIGVMGRCSSTSDAKIETVKAKETSEAREAKLKIGLAKLKTELEEGVVTRETEAKLKAEVVAIEE